MKEYQYLIGKIIVAVAIIVAAIIIAQAIGGAGESIRSGLLQLGGCSSITSDLAVSFCESRQSDFPARCFT